MLKDYEKELEELEEKLPKLKKQMQNNQGKKDGVQRWVEMIRSYVTVEHLDRCLARAQIEGITASDRYEKDGKFMQDITITYRFVGNLQKLLDKTKDVA